MNVGGGAFISNKYFPLPSENTRLVDSAGEVLYTGDVVEIRGCRARYGIIGRSFGSEVSYSLYFGVNGRSCEWHLSQDTLDRITKIGGV